MKKMAFYCTKVNIAGVGIPAAFNIVAYALIFYRCDSYKQLLTVIKKGCKMIQNTQKE